MPIYVNVDSPNLGFPYFFTFLGRPRVKKTPPKAVETGLSPPPPYGKCPYLCDFFLMDGFPKTSESILCEKLLITNFGKK